MKNKPTISMTIGPVQGFVSASRRTRDLWASSYLLSFLAGHAIVAVQNEGGRLILPEVEGDLLVSAIDGEHAQIATHGSLPNRFVAEVEDEEMAERAGRAAVDAVHSAWLTCADAVWQAFISKVASDGHNVRAIWDRQVENFWEISWVAGDHPGLLGQRKNWRSHVPPIEPGDHCSMMSQWQEISGWIRSIQRNKQEQFWDKLRGFVGELDLKESERLCAIALIKRLFPRVTREAIGWKVDRINWPSTSYLGAADWIRDVVHTDPEQANRFASKVMASSPNARGESNTYLDFLATNLRCHDFKALDGLFFYENNIENSNLIDLEEEHRSAVLGELRELYKSTDARPHGYYTVLLMDGDSMGALLQKAAKAGDVTAVSRALTSFSRQVPEVVERGGGITVYAGGDDVLALLPMGVVDPDQWSERTLRVASQLRSLYRDCFEQEDLDGASISAGIVYAHCQTPLKHVLAEAHELLDGVAKALTGRASVAISVLKPSGKQIQWSKPWECALLEDGRLEIEHLIDSFSREGSFSSSFFYALRERYGLLSNGVHWEPGLVSKLVSGLKPVDILTADYIRARQIEGVDIDFSDAHGLISRLVRACRPSFRVFDAPQDRFEIQSPENHFMFDAALLIRFLANPFAGDAI